MSEKHLVISFSGGETSGYMTNLLLTAYNNGELFDLDGNEYESVSVVFANTSLEHEETLIFVDKVSKWLGVEVVWLESSVNHGIKKSADYTIVDFKTAHRNGEVMEEVIRKGGIPNVSWLHCTRDTKNEPIKQWCRDKFGKNYEIAIGIRLDEKSREPKHNTYQTVYPLITEGHTKQDVIEFWGSQSFRLGIENYQGNCQCCYKKADIKLMLIAYENRKAFEFTNRMEEEHGLSGAHRDDNKRVFFRHNRSTKDILKMTDEMMLDDDIYQHARDRVVWEYNNSLFEGGCSEACEAFTQEDMFE